MGLIEQTTVPIRCLIYITRDDVFFGAGAGTTEWMGRPRCQQRVTCRHSYRVRANVPL